MLSALRPIARPLAGSLRTRAPTALKFSALRFVSTSAYRPPSHWSEPPPLVITLTFSSLCHSFYLITMSMRKLQWPTGPLPQPSTLLTMNGSLLNLRPTSVSLVSPSTPRRLWEMSSLSSCPVRVPRSPRVVRLAICVSVPFASSSRRANAWQIYTGC